MSKCNLEIHLQIVRFIGQSLENAALEKYVREDEPIHLTKSKSVYTMKKEVTSSSRTSPAQSLNQL
jgi:hypothetical protein